MNTIKHIFIISMLLISILIFFVPTTVKADTRQGFTEYNTLNGRLYMRYGGTWSASVTALIAYANPDSTVFDVYANPGSSIICMRGYLFYDTSSIPNDAVITRVNISFPTLTAAYQVEHIYVQSSGAGSSFEKKDYYYGNFTYLFKDYNWGGGTTAFNVTLDQNLTHAINVTGLSDFVVRLGHDYSNSAPGSGDWGFDIANEHLITLWVDYTTLPPNVAPTNSDPSPPDATHDVGLLPQLTIQVNDTDGDDMNVTFKTNATGVWGTIGTNASVGNGTYRWYNSSMDEYRTQYWWNVSTNDGMGHWDNDTYTFYTFDGVIATSFYPLNHSTNQITNITYRVWLFHTNGTDMDIYCYRDNGTVYLGSYMDSGNGTYNFFSNASLTNHIYNWSYNITDGDNWYNSTQWYETGTSSGGGVILIGNGDISIGSYMVTGIIIGLSFGGLLCIRTRRKRRQKDVNL